MRALMACVWLVGALIVVEAQADFSMMVSKSPHSVAATLDRFEAALKEQGIAVTARVDHAAAATAAGMKLRPTQLVIFGNPKLGTPLMQSDQRIGMDLPLKALAWEDDTGQVWLAVSRPSALAARHGISNRDEVVDKMTEVLNALAGRATRP
jgi:uncharacterized protein (DUF302 family)